MGASFTIERARLAGRALKRADAQRWLDLVPVEALGLAPSEILYVPRLPVQLRSDPRSQPRKAAHAVLEQLRRLSESAERDPRTAASQTGACRFSSVARYRAWLVRMWLGDVAERRTAVAATGASTLRDWQRRDVLRDGATIVALTAHLAEARLAVDWIARFDSSDCALAEASLARSFGLDLQAALRQTALVQPATVDARSSSYQVPARQAASSLAYEDLADFEVAERCRQLDDLTTGWRQLPPRARVLLVALVSLACDPTRTSRREYVFALVAAGAGAPIQRAATSKARLPNRSARTKPSAIPAVRGVGATPRQATYSRDWVDVPPRSTLSVTRPIGARAESNPLSSQHIVPAESDGTLPETRHGEIAAAASPLSFQSDFAGLLFLLNAFTGLGLYPDFASTGPARFAVSPLWLIDRVGCFWFGRRYRRDPLHRWITANSCGGQLPRAWSVDPAWRGLWKVGERPFIVERSRRISVWDSRGFPIEDVAAPFRHRITTARSRRRSIGVRRVPRLPAERNERWVACLSYFLDARIRLATGDQSVGLGALAQSAELTIDELDVTARFSFEPQTVPLRLAGLDRDPCWQPAEGRSFRFHFS